MKYKFMVEKKKEFLKDTVVLHGAPVGMKWMQNGAKAHSLVKSIIGAAKIKFLAAIL